MAKQTIKTGDFGARSQRVLEALTPKIGAVAPAVSADFIGQVYIDTVAGTIYMSVKTGSVAPADDWKQVSIEAEA